ncbi:zinc-dependent alcohol dehydrogenase family protein [Peribacillus frigoritolerans]|uniref:zinc-dependent alcohol dehydrogenase family protein n=1 Tax=Peribacillus frigoritolerans TaxID=450367 RepID=UPI00223013B2|nr:zinc-dependent alcohol dehydrogenase family protein [Peribacillus frigoritolerans]MDM5312520.1 zinc-dependent alcohol dehydrogenase family protein [Peribacillus frigoritolerans]UZD46110.1 zinc-dependent alcohol dehydrogenase family protein [Peribacillus frigoritolerans]WHX61132.1 zinc-dependent alcohol dehydrogenase family protein [Peribacillus frigoritolerans]
MEAKCIKFYEFGDPQKVLKVENKCIQKPFEGEVLVRMITRPINPSDLLPIRGAYSHRIPLPSIPGYEGVGIVEEVGPAVSIELIGKRVLPLRGEGTWQDYVKTSAELAIVIPDSIEDHIAAQLYINPITAWLICTEVLTLKPDDVLLVNACGSSIGRILAQLSKILGFKLIAVTRNDKYTEELLKLGASYVIDTSQSSLRDTVMEMTNGRGAKAAIDSVGGIDGSELAFCVRPNGILLTIGLLSGQSVNWAEISRRTKVDVKMFHLRHWNQQASVRTWHETFNILMGFIADEKLKFMMPDSHYSLQDVQEAIIVTSNQGKIFLSS